MVRRSSAVVILFLCACFTASAGVVSFNFTGNFTFDNDVQLFHRYAGHPGSPNSLDDVRCDRRFSHLPGDV